MTVIYHDKPEPRKFTASNLLWNQHEVARAIVREALVSHTEAYIDMMCDGGMGTTRTELQATLVGVKDSVGDMLDDVLSDLIVEIKSQLKEAMYGAIVTGIKYDLAGDVKDVDVDISVNWE